MLLITHLLGLSMLLHFIIILSFIYKFYIQKIQVMPITGKPTFTNKFVLLEHSNQYIYRKVELKKKKKPKKKTRHLKNKYTLPNLLNTVGDLYNVSYQYST